VKPARFGAERWSKASDRDRFLGGVVTAEAIAAFVAESTRNRAG
jgi:hypothetical protein